MYRGLWAGLARLADCPGIVFVVTVANGGRPVGTRTPAQSADSRRPRQALVGGGRADGKQDARPIAVVETKLLVPTDSTNSTSTSKARKRRSKHARSSGRVLTPNLLEVPKGSYNHRDDALLQRGGAAAPHPPPDIIFSTHSHKALNAWPTSPRTPVIPSTVCIDV